MAVPPSVDVDEVNVVMPVASQTPIRFGSKPTLIKQFGMQFLIMDAPKKENLFLYIKECKKHSVADVVRVCAPTYSSSEMTLAGIELHEMAYAGEWGSERAEERKEVSEKQD